MPEENSPSFDAKSEWRDDRTTFQRVYDVLVGTHEPAPAKSYAEWADCSVNGARDALSQLVDMGVAERTDTRPATYKRNPSYFTWKRVETLAREYSVSELQQKVDELIDEDDALQAKYGVPDPDAVVVDESATHEEIHERWDDLSEWRTIRRDISVLQQAVQRAESRNSDCAHAEP